MWARQWRRPPTDEELRGLVADHLQGGGARPRGAGAAARCRRHRRPSPAGAEDGVPARRHDPHLPNRRKPNCAASTRRVRTWSARRRACPSPRSSSTGAGGGSRRTARPAPSSRALSDAPARSGRLRGPPPARRHVRRSGRAILGRSVRRCVRAGRLLGGARPLVGPIASGYGLHLVKVTAVQPSRTTPLSPRFASRLAQEWHRQRQETARGAALRGPDAEVPGRRRSRPSVALLGPLASRCGGAAMRLSASSSRWRRCFPPLPSFATRSAPPISTFSEDRPGEYSVLWKTPMRRRHAPGAGSCLFRPGRDPDSGRRPG